MKPAILFLFLISFTLVNAQTGQQFASNDMARIPTADDSRAGMKATELRRFINNNLVHKSKRNLYVSCNDDSVYYNQDTIRLFQLEKNLYPTSECCTFIEWNMVSDASFLWTDLSTCNQRVDRSYFLHTTSIESVYQNQNFYLKIMRNGILLDIFKVVDLEKIPARHLEGENSILILVRQNIRTLNDPDNKI